jgi:ubiquinone/menaquinone biosynthesis C-methylase UbiE
MTRSVDYNRIAETFDRRYEENDYSGVEAALMAFVGEQADQRVLEVGCGTGHWLRSCHARGARVTGLDASARMLARAKAHAPGAMLAQGSAERLPWTGASFGRLFCVNAFHHFQDKVGFLAEAMRVLRPGGLIMTIGLDPHTGLVGGTSTSTSPTFWRSIGSGIRRHAGSGNGCRRLDSPTVLRARSSTCRSGSPRDRHWSRDASTRT